MRFSRFTWNGAFQPHKTFYHVVLQAKQRATWACEMWMRRNIRVYRDRMSITGAWEKNLENELAKHSEESTYSLQTHWTFFLDHYTLPQLTDGTAAVRQSTCCMCNEKMTAHTNDYTWTWKYSKAHCKPSKLANIGFLYTPLAIDILQFGAVPYENPSDEKISSWTFWKKVQP